MDPTILYVDDQQENLDGFRFTFRKNYEIHTALNAAQGFKILEENEISIVISDQRMPDILGTEFLNQVALRFPQCIRIILTAFADFDAVVGAINKGQVYRFLTKPWNRDEIRMTIENAHEAYLLRRENLKLVQDLQNANENLNSNNLLLQKEIEERKLIEKELQNHRNNLELIVAERTQQLAASNEELGAINEELHEVNQHLSVEIDQRKSFQTSLEELNAEYQSLNEELNTYNEELKTVNESLRIEIEKRKETEKLLAERTDELEALNEEYLAINEELQTTNFEISQLNDNLREEMHKREIAQKDLVQSEEKFRSFIEQSAEAIFIVDSSGGVIEVNESALKMFGVTREQLNKESIWTVQSRFLPVESRNEGGIQRIKNFVQDFLQSEEPGNSFLLENYFDPEKESRKFIQGNIFRINSSGSKYLGFTGRDLTEKKKSEEELRKHRDHLEELVEIRTRELLTTEARLQTLSDNLPGGTIFRGYTDQQKINHMVYASKGIENVTGLPFEKLKVSMDPFFERIFPEDVLSFNDSINQLGGTNMVLDLVFRYKKAPDEINWIQLRTMYSQPKDGVTWWDGYAIDITERKRAEEQAKEREIRFSTLFDLSPNMELITTLDGRIIEANGSFLKFSGFSKEEVIGQRIVDLKLWDSSDSIKLNEKFQKHNKVDNYEAFINPVNGDKRHVLLSLAPIKIKGEPYIISTGIDITERILAEQKLVESEERFRAILQNLSDSIWIVDKNTNILYESPSAQNMFGYREGELQGKKGLNLVHPDDRPEVLIEFGQSLKNIEGTTPTLFRVRTADGRYIFVEGISNNRIDHPAIKGIILTLRDVTERIVKDKALRESEQKFRNIFNSSTDAIIISSLEQKIIEVNDVVVKLSGYSREELLLKKTTDLATEKSIWEINKRFKQLSANESVPPIEIDFITGRGELIATEMTSRIIDYEDKKALLTLIRDITERKKLEKILIDTIIQTEEKERERMAADLHDEVGPLLSSMKMYLNSLVETKDNAKSIYIADQLQILIKESITAVREISNDLSPHILNNYGLAAAVRSAVETNLQFIAINLKENLENRRFSPNIEIIFYRIIRELLNNTIKHAGAKSIDISLFHTDEKMMLYYSDNGKGFDWHQVINSTRKGLGLMNILSRVKSMNGHYNIQTSPGKGFNFELTTPL